MTWGETIRTFVGIITIVTAMGTALAWYIKRTVADQLGDIALDLDRVRAQILTMLDDLNISEAEVERTYQRLKGERRR